LSGLCVAIGIWLVLLVKNWPFTQRAVVQALEDRFSRPVEVQSFRRTYFPPGCVAEGVSFLHRTRRNLAPLISVATLTVRGSYRGLLPLNKSVDKVEVAGLHIRIPPKAADDGQRDVFPLTSSVSGNSLAIAEITTDGAVLEFMSQDPGKEPFVLKIYKLKLDHVGEGGPLAFHAILRTSEPPGEIRSDGQAGPWNEDDPGSTPVSGSYTYSDVKLGVFEGIAGTLSAKGKMAGVIREINAEGEVDIPDIRSSRSSQSIHLTAKYDAVVNGTNGDTELHSVQTNFLSSTLFSKGTVAAVAGEHGKTARLEIGTQRARIEDLMRLFAGTGHPPVRGAVQLRAGVVLHPGPQGFLGRLVLTGDFGISGQHFTNPKVQDAVNRLDESAKGESKAQQAADSETVLSNLKGHVDLRNGLATLTNISFTEPGTVAEIAGTFNLRDTSLDLRGVLHTNGKLSDTSSGFKALVLKGIGPFLKKHTTTIVPFTITGTSSQPAFALDLAAKRRL